MDRDASPLRRLVMGAVLGAVSGALAVGEIRAFHPEGAAVFRAALYCLLASLLAVDPWLLGETRRRGTAQLALAGALVAVWAVTGLAGHWLGDAPRSSEAWRASAGAAAVGWAAAQLTLLLDALAGRTDPARRLLAAAPGVALALLLPVAASPAGDGFWSGPLPLALGLAFGAACAFGTAVLGPGPLPRGG